MMDSLRRRGARRLASGSPVVALLVAMATTLGAGQAQAYCRTTTTPIPASYSPTRGCFTDGLPLFWRGACVGYSVNGAASASASLDTAEKIIDAAFGAWNAASCASGTTVGITTSNLGTVTCGEVRYNTNGPNQNVIVFRDDRWPYSDPNNTLGLTTVTFNADTGEIYDADMEINATGKNLSTSDTVPVNGFDLLSVITHEAGHFLGLAHATDSKSTMFASYKPGTSTLRSLTSDDVAGACEIYPKATQRTVAKSVNGAGVIAADACDPNPRHGLGTGCAENPAPADQSSSGSGGGCAVSGGSSPADAPRAPGVLAFGVLALAGVAALARSRRRRSTTP